MSKAKKLLEKMDEQEIGFDQLPPGWDRDSLEQFVQSLTGDTDDELFTDCVNKMEGNVDDPEAFCAALKDEFLGTTMWRGEEQ